MAYWIGIFNAGGTTEDINSGFVGSVEYYNKASGALGGGAAGNPAQWIREAYLDILFRPAQVSEMAYWLNSLESGVVTDDRLKKGQMCVCAQDSLVLRMLGLGRGWVVL